MCLYNENSREPLNGPALMVAVTAAVPRGGFGSSSLPVGEQEVGYIVWRSEGGPLSLLPHPAFQILLSSVLLGSCTMLYTAVTSARVCPTQHHCRNSALSAVLLGNLLLILIPPNDCVNDCVSHLVETLVYSTKLMKYYHPFFFLLQYN